MYLYAHFNLKSPGIKGYQCDNGHITHQVPIVYENMGLALYSHGSNSLQRGDDGAVTSGIHLTSIYVGIQ